jgi:hypothetical protein
MEHQSSSSSPTYADVARERIAVVRVRRARWRQFLPLHRLPVIAKTPLLILVGVYVAGGRFESRPVLLSMLLCAGLWISLYALNEATDLEGEQGYWVERATKAWLFLLCCGACAAGCALSWRLGLLMTLMAAGQMIYCVPPLRLKRYWWAVLLLSGIMNPILRLECGAMWGTRAIPAFAYAVFICLHLGASMRSRSLLRRRDAKLGYHTAPRQLEWAGIACTSLGLAGACVLIYQGVLPPFCAVFIAFAVAFAFYAWAGPNGADISRLRRGWLLFALLGLLTLAAMLVQRLLPALHVWKGGRHEHTQRLGQNPQPDRRLPA